MVNGVDSGDIQWALVMRDVTANVDFVDDKMLLQHLPSLFYFVRTPGGDGGGDEQVERKESWRAWSGNPNPIYCFIRHRAQILQRVLAT